MDVIIGIDPHKSSHTAVAIDATEQVLDQLRLVTGNQDREGRARCHAHGHRPGSHGL